MKRKNVTRNALFTSIISLLLCVSMLVGTTFAWFTDSVESGRNVIAAGNLDVELYNDDGPVTGNTVLFDDVNPNLWEPGAVAYENLQVKNVGSLALKYNLNLSVLDETVVNGYRLSDVIMVGIVEDGITSNDRNEVISEVKSWTNLAHFNMNMNGVELAADAEGEKFGIVLYWQPNDNEIDNHYNLNNGQEGTLQLDIGVNLYATQVEAESDSFGDDYDENSPYDDWDGSTPAEMPETLIVDGDTQTIHVKDAAGLAYLSTLSDNWAELYTDGNGRDYTNYANGAGANYYYSGQWTISLDADIDLNNHRIAPIRIMIGEATGASTFKGNNHVIRNINTTTGLFADNNRTTYSDLTLVNVKATNGALAGSANASIYNVTVKNATISGGDYVGGLVGYIYGGVSNCKVIDSNVTATGKEAGGLIGYVATSADSAEVVNNEVNNVTVFAGNRAAGLVAQVNEKVKVYNNVIDTVTIGAEDTSEYQPNAVVSNALVPENVYNNTVINANVLGGLESVAEGVLKSADEKTFYLSSKEGFEWMESQSDSYFAGKTVTLAVSIDFGGETIDAIRFWEPENKTTFDGNGMTISNFVLENTDGIAGLFNGTMTVKNLNIVGAEVTGKYAGVIAGNMYGDIINCTVKDSVINGTYWQTGALVGQYNGGNIIDCVVENCEINGLAAVGGLVGILNESAGERKIENCTVKDCEINQTGSFGGDYDKMFGVVTGCVNIENSTVTISGVYEGNTVKGTASDVLCGDVADSTKIYVLTTASNGMMLKEDVATGAMSLSSVADLTEEDVTIPAEVSALGNAVFAGNANITSVTIPATVTDFGASGVSETNASGGAFKGSNVKTVTLSEGMTEIPAAAFNGATKLTSVNIPASVKKIGVNAFRSTALTELTIPATVKEIACGAFRDMDSLTTVTIEGDEVTLPGYVFRDCSALRTVYLNMNTLTLNGSMNFANASSNNPNTNNITFYCKNNDVADAVKAHMGVGSYVAIYVNGTLYAEIK